MSKKYLIICEETCLDCNGKGIIANEIYDELTKYTKSLPEWLGVYSDEICQKQDEWMGNHGYSGGLENYPPEEYECTTCGGSGTIRHEVDLAEVLEELKIQKKEKQSDKCNRK